VNICYISLFLHYFLYFEKIKGDLRGHLALCLYIPPPISVKRFMRSPCCLFPPPPDVFVCCAVCVLSKEGTRLVLARNLCFKFDLFQKPMIGGGGRYLGCPPCPIVTVLPSRPVQILAAVCQSLVLNYGMSHSLALGPSYDSFLTTVSSCLLTASVLLICYLLSERSIGLLRTSLFVSNRFGALTACHSFRFVWLDAD
jgi:hypothetical protein